MTKIVVLGAGMVGSLIAADLAREPAFEVTATDRSPEALEKAKALAARLGATIDTRTVDHSDQSQIRALAQEADVLCGALASHLALAALETICKAGAAYSDISFMPEDAVALDALAKEHGARCVVDIGVAPGMSNLLAAAIARELDPCEKLRIFVGGLPKARTKPYEYKAAFAPADVIEEYTRTARLVVGGKTVIREALSEPEPIEFPGVGTLEAFNTDGLRSLADTLDVPDMAEKTLRYPGHIDLMRAMRDTGLFSKEPVEVGGVSIVPLELTSRLLFPHWTFDEGEPDLTVMRIYGEAKGRRIQWDLHDELDPQTNTTSMARTTAYPAAIVARMLADNTIKESGVHPPEAFANREDIITTLLSQLADRGVNYHRSDS